MTRDFKPNPYPGLFVVIEGLDGAGATTQVTLLSDRLRQDDLRAFPTKEPTGNVIGGLIRGALTGFYELPAQAIQLLFVADRLLHLKREIIPMLQNDHIVICDRYIWSTVAFGSVDIRNRRWLLSLNRYCFLPDISIFLEVPPKECLKRLKEDRFDFELFEEEHKLWKVWETYVWLQKKFKDEITVIDGTGSPDKIHDQISSLVKTHPKFSLYLAATKKAKNKLTRLRQEER